MERNKKSRPKRNGFFNSISKNIYLKIRLNQLQNRQLFSYELL
jgi:hypothetical protein